jgi:hypothetical protein
MMDPNTSPEVHKLYNKFEIVVMWDNGFVHLCKVSKILNNKHCGLAMSKTMYQKNLGHAHRIWNIYERPLPNFNMSS